MTRPVPIVIVTLPAVSADQAREQVETAKAAGADVAELRLDRWSEDDLQRASTLFPSPIPLLATLRSRAEGGEGPNDPEERAGVLLALARLPFGWVDLEADRDLGLTGRLDTVSKAERIVSVHLLPDTSPEEWARRLREPTPDGIVRKVVLRASIGTLFDALLPHLPPPGTARVAAMTTGASGPLLRAASRRLGAPLVFASLPQPGTGPNSEISIEPSQVPVDRLRPYLQAEGEAPLFGVAGHPVAHSHSPRLHSRWMLRSRRGGLYLPLDFASEQEFVDALAPLARFGFRGLNVTHPLKQAALAAASRVRPGASECGVANCLTLRDETVEAENTDLLAAARRLRELVHEGRWDGRSLLVVGTGGSARATLAAARQLGADRKVVGRSPDRAGALARVFDAEAIAPTELEPEALVVQATEVGRSGAGDFGLPFERLLGPGTQVLDWVYAPDRTVVADLADRAGARYEDGRRLLVYQAAASFENWWGEPPSSDDVRRALEEEGCTA